MECLQLFKGFNVANPQIVAFVFPQKEVDTCMVKLTMGFDSEFVKFTYSIKCSAINEVSAVLKMAVINNKAACNNLSGEPKLGYTVWLTPEQRCKYW